MYIYIIIDSNGYVIGNASSSNETISPDHILVSDTSEADDKMWDSVNSVWVADDRSFPDEIREISRIDFIELFTDTEAEDLIEFAKTNKKAALFITKVKMHNVINLNNAKVQAGITAMETVGVIGAGRANEIINSTSDAILIIQPPKR